MCAYVDLEKQAAFLEKHKGKKTVKIYKLFYFDEWTGDLKSLYMNCIYLPGIIKSGSRAKLQTQNKREINKGIHAYTSLKVAQSYSCYDDIICVLEANLKDLICVGTDNDCVFKKVTLSEREYNRALKVKKC